MPGPAAFPGTKIEVLQALGCGPEWKISEYLYHCPVAIINIQYWVTSLLNILLSGGLMGHIYVNYDEGLLSTA